MTGMEIVREETRRMLRGMLPLTVIAFGVFILCGVSPVKAGVSLLAGACYSLLLFRIVRRGYFFRYVLTGAVVVAAIKMPFLHALAVVVPLFFPKIIILWSDAVHRKGG